jgi:uncharacterized membrane protein AbrB (regulator of aidB expression)
MKGLLPKILSYISAMTLGMYIASQFKFNHPVEEYRWLITGFFFIMFTAIANSKD